MRPENLIQYRISRKNQPFMVQYDLDNTTFTTPPSSAPRGSLPFPPPDKFGNYLFPTRFIRIANIKTPFDQQSNFKPHQTELDDYEVEEVFFTEQSKSEFKNQLEKLSAKELTTLFTNKHFNLPSFWGKFSERKADGTIEIWKGYYQITPISALTFCAEQTLKCFLRTMNWHLQPSDCSSQTPKGNHLQYKTSINYIGSSLKNDCVIQAFKEIGITELPPFTLPFSVDSLIKLKVELIKSGKEVVSFGKDQLEDILKIENFCGIALGKGSNHLLAIKENHIIDPSLYSMPIENWKQIFPKGLVLLWQVRPKPKRMPESFSNMSKNKKKK